MNVQRTNLTRARCKICVLREMEKQRDTSPSITSKRYYQKIVDSIYEQLARYAFKAIKAKPLHLCNEQHVSEWRSLRARLKAHYANEEKRLRKAYEEAVGKLNELRMKVNIAVLNDMPKNDLIRLQYDETRWSMKVAQRRRRLAIYLEELKH